MDALTIMKRLGQGRALEDFGDAIKSVAAEAALTGKGGAVSLKVEIKPLDDLMIAFKETIARTPPKTGERGAILFTYDGDLFTADPRQTVLPKFEMVDGNHGDTATGEIVERADGGTTVEAI